MRLETLKESEEEPWSRNFLGLSAKAWGRSNEVRKEIYKKKKREKGLEFVSGR